MCCWESYLSPDCNFDSVSPTVVSSIVLLSSCMCVGVCEGLLVFRSLKAPVGGESEQHASFILEDLLAGRM